MNFANMNMKGLYEVFSLLFVSYLLVMNFHISIVDNTRKVNYTYIAPFSLKYILDRFVLNSITDTTTIIGLDWMNNTTLSS